MADWCTDSRAAVALGCALLFGATVAAAADAPVSANGRLEGTMQTAELYFAQTGRIATIAVVEGQAVKQGEALATLDCTALDAELAVAKVRLDIAKRGGRSEAVARQQAAVAALDAETRRYEAQVRRLATLAPKDLASKSALEDAQLLVAETRARRDVAEKALVETRNPAPAEERREAAAQVDATSAQLGECTLRAPSDGVVLRRLLEPGAAVSALMPEPVLTFADVRTWNARAEVDEADVGRIRIGQKATVTAPAFGSREVNGSVVQLSGQMGRRDILSGDPAEKMDRDVREVLIRLDAPPPAAVVGLRVKVRFKN